MNNEEFRNDRKNTLIGKIAKGTIYEDYALNNKILNKNKNFIQKKTESAKFSFGFIYENVVYGVWNDFKNRKMFCFL